LPPCDVRLGTTRGTNALLERRGAATVLAVTRGFGGLLAIGTQARPRLFGLTGREPPPLYAEGVRIDERSGTAGIVPRPRRARAGSGRRAGAAGGAPERRRDLARGVPPARMQEPGTRKAGRRAGTRRRLSACERVTRARTRREDCRARRDHGRGRVPVAGD